MTARNHSETVGIELIRSLFESITPAAIMTVAFVASGALMVWSTGDTILLGLLLAGTVASLARIAVTVFSARSIMQPDIPFVEAKLLQSRFAAVYIGFAVVLGAFGHQAFRLPNPEVHMVMICLVMGYCAGVAASVGLRPRIAVPSMLVTSLPMVVSAMSRADPLYWAMSLMTVAFLVGGIKAVRMGHRRAVTSISRRLAFATLAREDPLTTLPNRLALREWFNERVTFAKHPGRIAVHYLDLNGFKPVNDTYGHPVGDTLLAAVGGRLANTIRSTDIAARLGGDEFAVIQCNVASEEEAAMLAQRLATTIARPFRLGEREIAISTCIGYVTSDKRSDDLEYLLSLADEALYRSKRTSRGVVSYETLRPPEEREAA
jgi:diguanylate cyclase (GGDEF)-like protein